MHAWWMEATIQQGTGIAAGRTVFTYLFLPYSMHVPSKVYAVTGWDMLAQLQSRRCAGCVRVGVGLLHAILHRKHAAKGHICAYATCSHPYNLCCAISACRVRSSCSAWRARSCATARCSCWTRLLPAWTLRQMLSSSAPSAAPLRPLPCSPLRTG